MLWVAFWIISSLAIVEIKRRRTEVCNGSTMSPSSDKKKEQFFQGRPFVNLVPDSEEDINMDSNRGKEISEDWNPTCEYEELKQRMTKMELSFEEMKGILKNLMHQPNPMSCQS
ncbi:hypothetical protein MtrunA17_Chr4g0002061 [Medicago truncatula]|uniref:Uncharacterized protein n=1 Tax=Medicago truncatula TaxID=3880 RepID=A0A396I2I6_MEDTR|nr:hypothetical protein MtrunA17_Chr4g0002061 [Medicago truncatula]